MRYVLSALTCLLVSLLAAGCGRARFEEARPDEPHAIVKVRVVYHAEDGPQLDQEVIWNELGVQLGPLGPGTPRQRLRAMRVRPEPGLWHFSSVFFHTETRTEMQTYYETERYACGTDTVRSGTYTRTQTRYCTRQVPRQRWVPVTRRYDHARCRTGVRLLPRVGAVYLVQYEYFGDTQCTARCFRQLPSAAPGEEFRLVPCGAGEPPAGATTGGESVQDLRSTPPAPPAYGR